MKHNIILLALLWAMPAVVCAQLQVHGHVIDGETGQELPFVAIYLGPDRGALTNIDGDFTLEAQKGEMLQFSFIGYEKLQLRAEDCPAVVKLKPMAAVMREVTILSGTNLLELVARRLNKEFSWSRRKQNSFFYRLSTQYGKRMELAESFMKARSAINLRELSFMRGLRGQFSDRGFEESHMDSTNQHVLVGLGPMTKDAEFWNGTLIPLNDPKLIKKYYDTSCAVLSSANGDSLYRITLGRRDSMRLAVPYLEGTLYVAPKKLRLLRFEGEMKNLQMKVVGANKSYLVPIDVKLHANYLPKRRGTYVTNIALQIKKGKIVTRSLLYNIDELKIRLRKGHKVSRNMLETIDQAGYDSTLWAASNIVQRTNEEEQAAFSDSTVLHGAAERRLDPILQGVRQALLGNGSVVPLRPTPTLTISPANLRELEATKKGK
ncbi:MAG: carboxypeptidase-like regulatory domain-containing protein [Bacteroidaceae bacterium]|nr:carboxypeptidase-like regulatory domain-containing protein [Bacteroidaceae bacterium]